MKTHDLAVPRIAILHTWTNTQNDGWYRIEFDRLQIPYTYISDQVVRNTPNLRDKYDVIIFPPLGGTAQAIVNGIPMRGDPIPWKQSELTPNMGLSPDQTDDMRGGMGLAGVVNLQKFVQDGGLFVVVTNTARIADRLWTDDRRQHSGAASTAGARVDLQREVQRSQQPDRLWLRRDAADLLQSGAAVSGGCLESWWRRRWSAEVVRQAGRPSGRGIADRSGHRAGNAAAFTGAFAVAARVPARNS